MNGFSLQYQNLTLEVGLTNLDSLKLHEETLDKLLESLAKDIIKKGVVKHPVIVDANSLTVLDGMHRVQALKIIGCIRALTCKLDYQNPAIRMKFYYRTLDNIEMDIAERLVYEMNIPVQEREFNSTILNSPDLIMALISKGRSLISEKKDRVIEEAYNKIKALEKRLNSIGRISYYPEDEALNKVSKDEVSAALAVPKLKKKDIIELTNRGYLLPPKTTMHIIPARPLGVNAPLDLLMNKKMDAEEANTALVKSLKRRRIQKLEPRTVFEGRYYEEELYFFK